MFWMVPSSTGGSGGACVVAFGGGSLVGRCHGVWKRGRGGIVVTTGGETLGCESGDVYGGVVAGGGGRVSSSGGITVGGGGSGKSV